MTRNRRSAPTGKGPQDDARNRCAEASSDHGVTTGEESQVKRSEKPTGATWNPAPARGYSWPPFEPGHTLSLVHGAYSPRLVREAARPIVALLVQELASEAPWLSSPAFQLELESYTDAVAARRMLADDIAERSAAGKQVPLRSFEVLGTLTNAAGRAADRLGLNPLGKARLAALVTGAEVGQATLADLAATGRQTAGYRAAIEAEAEDGDDVA